MNEIFDKWQGAVIYSSNQLGALVVPAAHVFETVDGFAVVGPGHLFPEISHLNHFHRFAGKLTRKGDSVTFDSAGGSGRIEEWEASIQQQKDTGASLNDYENRMEELGTTYAEQRAELLAILAPELAMPLTSK